jgi:hypothetical protein
MTSRTPLPVRSRDALTGRGILSPSVARVTALYSVNRSGARTDGINNGRKQGAYRRAGVEGRRESPSVIRITAENRTRRGNHAPTDHGVNPDPLQVAHPFSFILPCVIPAHYGLDSAVAHCFTRHSRYSSIVSVMRRIASMLSPMTFGCMPFFYDFSVVQRDAIDMYRLV